MFRLATPAFLLKSSGACLLILRVITNLLKNTRQVLTIYPLLTTIRPFAEPELGAQAARLHMAHRSALFFSGRTQCAPTHAGPLNPQVRPYTCRAPKPASAPLHTPGPYTRKCAPTHASCQFRPLHNQVAVTKIHKNQPVAGLSLNPQFLAYAETRHPEHFTAGCHDDCVF